LGIRNATFEYPEINMPWPTLGVGYYYTTRSGIRTDQFGRVVNMSSFHPVDLFSTFPVLDKDHEYFEIYTNSGFVRSLLGTSKLYDLSGKDINDQVKSLAQQSVRSLWNTGEGLLEANSPILAVELGSFTEPLMFTYANWSTTRTDQNDIKCVFDWNTAEIGVKYSSSGGWSPNLATTSQSYRALSLFGYGLGRRGSSWKGSNVRFND
jgi:hypothetical protein